MRFLPFIKIELTGNFSVEERVGILDAETKEKYILAAQAFGQNEAFRIQQAQDDHIDRFRRFAQYMINLAVALAIMIKQSPLPGGFGDTENVLIT